MPRKRDRVDNYEGTQAEYIAYLEEEIRKLRRQRSKSTDGQTCTQQPRPSPACPGSHSQEPNIQQPDSQQHPSPDSRRAAPLPTPPPEPEWISWNPQQGFDKEKKAPLKWPDRVKPFFEAVPQDEEQWQVKRRALGLSDPDGILSTFTDLISCGYEESANNNRLSESESILVSFGRRVGALIRRAERLRKLSHFCSLIFIAACCVALENGHPVQSVDEALQEFFRALRGTKCTAKAKTLAGYRRSALWILKRMDELYWSLGHRAFELFLHGGATVTMFEPLVGDPRMPEAFRKKIAVSEPIEEEHASLPLCPALLVWFNFSHTWRFSTICKALRTSLFSEEEAQKYLQTYRARKLYVCRSPKESPSVSSTGRPNKRKRACEEGAGATHEVPGSVVEEILGTSNQRYEGASGLAGFSLLNRDDNTTDTSPRGLVQEPASDVAGRRSFDKATACDIRTVLVPKQSDAAPGGVVTSLLKAIQIEKHTLQEIVLERPMDVLGGIWFGSPQGYPPTISLRLSRALDTIIKASGQVVYVPGSSPGTGNTVTGVHLIELGDFGQMVRKDGFGEIIWNECGEEAYVTIVVQDESLVEDFLPGAVSD